MSLDLKTKLDALVTEIASLPPEHPVRVAMNEYLDARADALNGNFCFACGMVIRRTPPPERP